LQAPAGPGHRVTDLLGLAAGHGARRGRLTQRVDVAAEVGPGLLDLAPQRLGVAARHGAVARALTRVGTGVVSAVVHGHVRSSFPFSASGTALAVSTVCGTPSTCVSFDRPTR